MNGFEKDGIATPNLGFIWREQCIIDDKAKEVEAERYAACQLYRDGGFTNLHRIQKSDHEARQCEIEARKPINALKYSTYIDDVALIAGGEPHQIQDTLVKAAIRFKKVEAVLQQHAGLQQLQTSKEDHTGVG